MILLDGFTITNFLYKFNAHWGAAHALLGGRPPLDGARSNDGYRSFGSQRTFDHLLADRIGKTTPVSNIVLGGSDRNNEGHGLNISWTGPRQAQAPVHDPDKAFAALFSGKQTVPMASDSQDLGKVRMARQWEKDLLGFSRSQVATFRKNLGASERKQLEEYEAQLKSAFDAVRTDTADVISETVLTCKNSPNFNGLSATVSATGDRRHHELQMKTLAAALAFGRTRVAVYVMAGIRSGLSVPGARGGHHLHDNNAHGHYHAFDKYYGDRIKFFLNELSKYPEGDGTVLDHTTIMWTSDISWTPAEHPHYDHPIYIMGGLPRGKLKIGQYIKVPSQFSGNRLAAINERRNRRLPEILLLTIANQMGAPLDPEEFMDMRYYNGLVQEIMG